LLATYGTPAALRPFVFPFPAIFVWFGGIVVGFWVHVRDRFSRRRADRKARPSTRLTPASN
jgi:hypothetical protein